MTTGRINQVTIVAADDPSRRMGVDGGPSRRKVESFARSGAEPELDARPGPAPGAGAAGGGRGPSDCPR